MGIARVFFAAIIIISCYTLSAQIGINTDGNAPDTSAMLDVQSETSGLLVPRMSEAQREAINGPATGLLVFQIDGTAGFYYNLGTPMTPNWMQLSSTLITKLADADDDTKIEVEQNTDEDHIHFTTADTVRMTIDQFGRTGIGTTTPYNNLTIYSDKDNNGITFRTTDNSFRQGINFRNSGGYYVWNIFRREADPGRADLIFANAKKSQVGELIDRVVFKDGGAVGIGTSPDASAILDVESTDKGFLPPRMTEAERDAISNPADGLVIFNTTTDCLNFFGSGYWNKTCGLPDPPTVYNPATGLTWMDRNLGASRVATSSTDSLAYGDLYQWGRAREGHEIRSSDETATNATTAVPNAGNSWDGLFITESSYPNDWLIPQDSTLWQGEEGVNNPCPKGFRLPTEAELVAEGLTWSSNNIAGAFGSPLKLVAGGRRNDFNGGIYSVGTHGYYWSSTIDDDEASEMRISSSIAEIISSNRGEGGAVRCILD